MGTFSKNLRKFIGNWDYSHSGTSQSLLATTWNHLLNDANGAYTDKTQGATDITDVYNKVTSQFDFSNLKIGDVVDIRFTVEYTILTPNTDIEARMNMAIGHIDNYQVQIRPNSNFKTTGMHLVTSNIKISMDNQFTLDYPAQVESYTENAVDVSVGGWKIFVTKRSL